MRKLFRFFKKYAPNSLLGRVLMILILPTILAQAVSIYIFYERHFDHVTRQLTLSLAAEVTTVTEYVKTANSPEDSQRYLERAVTLFAFSPKLMTPAQVSEHTKNLKVMRNKGYDRQLRSRLTDKYEVFTDGQRVITTIIHIPGGKSLVIDSQYKRLVNSTNYIFILWMTGTTALLLLISILFLKNQIRPIVRLARLADNFGRGNDISHAYKPEGAAEIRQAFKAFNNMQQRLSRFIKQRTDMLAGISHDLRTPVTRMKLELALHKDKSEFAQEMEKDLNELEYMINTYIDFARGDEGENPSQHDYGALIEETIARHKDKDIKLNAEPIIAYSRPNALKRVFSNIVENSLKYATTLNIKVYKSSEYAIIEFEDNGIGIEPSKREEVFKPFYRVESSRNAETGGIGLGLSVVRDIVNSHGGTVHLEDSSLGGLKVVIKLPV